MEKQWKQCQTLFFGAPKSLQMVTAAMKLKDAYSLELSCFFHDPADVGNLISGSSAFSKTSLFLEHQKVHSSHIAEAWLGEF